MSGTIVSRERRQFMAGGLAFGMAVLLAGMGESRAGDAVAVARNVSMPRRRLGPLEVSAVGLGCLPMVGYYGGVYDKKAMIALIRTAFDEGVTFFDTAEVYGPHISEEWVGEALAPVRHRAVIATKFGFGVEEGRAQNPEQPSRPYPARGGGFAAAAAHRLYRSSLPAPGGPPGAHGRCGRNCGGAHPGGQGQAFRAVRGRGRLHSPAHAVQPVAAVQSEYAAWWREPETKFCRLCASSVSVLCPTVRWGAAF